jgi:hypothetical protein
MTSVNRANPKASYAAPGAKGANYQIVRRDEGTIFTAVGGSADGIVFSLPDSNADADVVNMVVQFRRQARYFTVAPVGTDAILFNGVLVTSIKMMHPDDEVTLVCASAGYWVVTGIKGYPQLGEAPDFKRWTPFELTYVDTSNFDVEPTPELLDRLRPGVPFLQTKIVDPGTRAYGVITAVTLAGSKARVTITGQPLNNNNSAWFYGSADYTEQRTITIPGRFGDADCAQLIQDDLNTFFRWDEDDAYLVNVEAVCIKQDTAGVYPDIDVYIGGKKVLSSGINVKASPSWLSAGIDFVPDIYAIGFNEAIEIGVYNNGGEAKDSEDLTVVLTFVKDKNHTSDFEPCAASDPLLNLVISGLVGPATWCGLANGVHAVCPSSYTLTPMPTTGTLFQADEQWVFKTTTATSGYYDRMVLEARRVIPTASGSTTAARSAVKLIRMTGTTPSYVMHQASYTYPTAAAPWPGRIRDRLMGSAVLGGVTFTWSKAGNRWYAG